MLVLTNAEWEHTDWFPSLSALQAMFGKAIAALPKKGVLVTNPHDPNIAALVEGAASEVADYTQEVVPELRLIGEFNKMNARAAAAAARSAFPDISSESISKSLSEFKGSWRRFEKKGETKEGALVYDDYAHHPTAIAETLKAAREKFPERTIIVAFHPHLYSRTRDLMEGFARAFSDADEVLVAPIYAAREEPIPGVTAAALAENISAQGTEASGYQTLEEVERALRSRLSTPGSPLLILTMGAGDIYKVADALVK